MTDAHLPDVLGFVRTTSQPDDLYCVEPFGSGGALPDVDLTDSAAPLDRMESSDASIG